TTDDGIAALNAQWRGVEGPTDVLSFPLDEPSETDDAGLPVLLRGARVLGDIVVSIDTAQRLVSSLEHQRRVVAELGESTPSWTLREEVRFLVIHGLLHLIGHDHADAAEEQRMKREEARLYTAVANRL